MPRRNDRSRDNSNRKSRKQKSSQAGGGERNKRSIKSSVINFLKDNQTEPFNYKQIAAKLGLRTDKEKDDLLKSLEELLVDGDIEEIKRGKYKPIVTTQFLEGKVDMTKTGSAYILVEDLDEDIYVPAAKLKQALHGDKVRVLLYARRQNKKPEGEVVEIIERRTMEFVGTIQVHEKFAFLVPDSQRMPIDLFIPLSKLGRAENGQKVVAKIEKWPEDAKSPIGRVIKVLGYPGEHSTEMNAIIAEFDLPEEFPQAVEEESEAISEEIPENEIDRRWDFRDVPTFTIDPVDAKDFDDALSIRKMSNNMYEVGVHIADVTYYVREDSELDKEAQERGTSVYLVDRVIPMLPEKLSNKLCSLRPNEDKLCFAVVLVLDENAHVKKEWYGRTIINSQRRFAYEEAQEVLETGEGDFAEELLTLNKLAYKLRERKFAEGAISFETEEVKFELDENGKPLRVFKKTRKDAHKLIEDFMLLANRKVAEYIFKKNEAVNEQPFVYRSHDNPDPDKLANFARVAGQFGYRFQYDDPKKLPQAFNQLLTKIEGRPEQNMLQSLAIRSMAKATYTTKKSSHYGLAFDYYTHFTSPIRRYPDVLVHRLLAHYLSNKKGIEQEHIETMAKHSSEMEIRAAEAERASIKYKQVEFMRERIGQVFRGIISGVTDWGIFVELIENKCEGMVRISSMKDDYYVFEEEKFLIRGHNSGKIYQLGDKVVARCIEANLASRNIDFEFEDEEDLSEEEQQELQRQSGPPLEFEPKEQEKFVSAEAKAPKKLGSKRAKTAEIKSETKGKTSKTSKTASSKTDVTKKTAAKNSETTKVASKEKTAKTSESNKANSGKASIAKATKTKKETTSKEEPSAKKTSNNSEKTVQPKAKNTRGKKS